MNNAVILDNAEVLFCASENGRNYFAYGDVPFAAFTVSDYLNYRRALCAQAPIEKLLEAFRISPRTRLGRLCPSQMRCVSYIEKTGGSSEKPIVINLDGAKYSRRNAVALRRLTKVCPDAFVCITDRRFLRSVKSQVKTLLFGSPSKRKRPNFYSAKLLARKIKAKRVSVM